MTWVRMALVYWRSLAILGVILSVLFFACSSVCLRCTASERDHSPRSAYLVRILGWICEVECDAGFRSTLDIDGDETHIGFKPLDLNNIYNRKKNIDGHQLQYHPTNLISREFSRRSPTRLAGSQKCFAASHAASAGM